ncbi:hypothetical protein glysoja_037632 [Glycine soja]|uniref:Uncharacterized protein n=1 Tax=Glycine soja TaxID=3848 RepID=A0A0B2P4M4_GLYSO|nr:hypothetical protein glysoja_037632 [Glycine soja]
MIAIFIDLARKEMHTAICSSRSIVKDAPPIDNKSFLDTSFWNTGILELVELVQRPPQGGPPSLPEQSDAEVVAIVVVIRRLSWCIEEASAKSSAAVHHRGSFVTVHRRGKRRDPVLFPPLLPVIA